jgi:hypothetical protein
MNKVIVETDSILAKSALKSNTFALTPTGGTVYITKNLIDLYFSSVLVAFCPGNYNKIGHAMAALVSVLTVPISVGRVCWKALRIW